ncbi:MULTISPECIES: FAD binding domain-containing protein [Nostocales]|uniref:Molybdopterin dehydrogenase n=2 Tax=Nostocales TaxID=1161 RepID=A0A0C1R2U3_9CYAN|nr:xanthine dehydrogenase family protein subunit M [Tolypothrix bouteillei]KAF3886045.1 xanthine dehydrogenase family protein subunit M [Tolypothrix bouteillei VB521301]
MKNFIYQKAKSADAAINLIGQNANAKFLGGGTNLVDLMRENIERLDAVVDVTHLPAEIEETADGAIRIGAAVKNTALANHETIREKFPVLSQAILFGASGQIRNMATVGGNILQRTRCYYFYDNTARCNKREIGTGCDAIDGFNRIHAILGASDACIATHPSDMCVALAALDARVLVRGANGSREIAFNDFHRLPENTPHIETALQDGELITAIEIPRNDFAKNSLYQKVRDRASYAFALVSVAGALEIENHQIKNVRIALGGVAHKPWRAFAAEEVLLGLPATEENFWRGAEAELENARGFANNSFKIELAKRVIVGVLKELAEQGGTNR